MLRRFHSCFAFDAQTYERCVFGLANINDIVESTVDVDKLASIQIGTIGHLFFSIKHKKTESYVIHRIWDKLDDMSILFKGQQEVLI